MICSSIQHKTYEEIIDILDDRRQEMAEVRLDRCKLSDRQISELFSQSDTPLIATCRISETGSAEESGRRLKLAVEAGARFADLEIEAPAEMSKAFQKTCRRCGTEIIRSYHNFEDTPDDESLYQALARCFRYGADIAKIVTTCHSEDDTRRIEALYSVILEDIDSLQGRLVAFGMGEEGRQTRLECLRRGAPFTYTALSSCDAAAPGQWTTNDMHKAVYGDRKPFDAAGLQMPASKSFAQRAIIAAALAEGVSRLDGYSPCGDSESAIKVAQALGAEVHRQGSALTIKGIAAEYGKLSLDRLDTGESGLLTRLMIPLLSALDNRPFTIVGEGTLLKRPLKSSANIMASFGVLLSSQCVPVEARGQLIPGSADISGKDGSQLISGLLMALPICNKDSAIQVDEPKSIPYMYITLDVLRHFGIWTRSEMEGDSEMNGEEDWSRCSGIEFKIRGGQTYKAAEFAIEGDWSAAANFLVAGAIFGSAEILGMDSKSLQADISVLDILVDAGAAVSQLEDNTICVRKAPLEAFLQDLNNAPDLFPIIAVLAAFCSGESRIAGVGRLASKESDRASAILQMLTQMGVEASIEGDELVICGETLVSRILNGRLLKGGNYSSGHDHRMVMALKVADLATESPIVIDDEACVGKSFPNFMELITTRP